MKKSRFTEEQITYALRKVEAGTQAMEVCREMGISEQTFYRWRRKYAAMGVAELRRLKQFENENTRLKRLVADLTLDKHILQEVIRKKLVCRAVRSWSTSGAPDAVREDAWKKASASTPCRLGGRSAQARATESSPP